MHLGEYGQGPMGKPTFSKELTEDLTAIAHPEPQQPQAEAPVSRWQRVKDKFRDAKQNDVVSGALVQAARNEARFRGSVMASEARAKIDTQPTPPEPSPDNVISLDERRRQKAQPSPDHEDLTLAD